MGNLNYNGKTIAVPDYVNGRKIRQLFGIPQKRSVYTTNLDGKSQIVSDGDKMWIRDSMTIGDIPQTEKG